MKRKKRSAFQKTNESMKELTPVLLMVGITVAIIYGSVMLPIWLFKDSCRTMPLSIITGLIGMYLVFYLLNLLGEGAE